MAKPRVGRFLYGFKHILEALLGGLGGGGGGLKP